MPTDRHDLGKDPLHRSTSPAAEQGNPGYETSDVNINGVVVFLSGLIGFVFIFFIFCFIMGRVINHQFLREDGPPTKWQQERGALVPAEKRENLTSSAEMDQKQLQRMTKIFPTPRLDVDDGNQATADLHAREDLLLNHYSSINGQPNSLRVPIERAMELIIQRQLSVAATAGNTLNLAADETPIVQVPLTTGFARTGYELDTIEAREQKMSYTKSVGKQHAAPASGR